MNSSINIHDATSIMFKRHQRNDLHWLEIRVNGKDGHFDITVFSDEEINIPEMHVRVLREIGDNDAS